ncbi:hypothetical protein ACLOJK_039910 [Asimina triloba]
MLHLPPQRKNPLDCGAAADDGWRQKAADGRRRAADGERWSASTADRSGILGFWRRLQRWMQIWTAMGFSPHRRLLQAPISSSRSRICGECSRSSFARKEKDGFSDTCETGHRRSTARLGEVAVAVWSGRSWNRPTTLLVAETRLDAGWQADDGRLQTTTFRRRTTD